MIDYSNVTWYNATGNSSSLSFNQVCLLDQQAMLDSLQKFPKIVFFLLLTAFVFLVIELYFTPNVKYLAGWSGVAGQASITALMFGLWMSLPVTFHLSQNFYNVLGYVLPIITIGIVVFVILKFKKKSQGEEL